MSTHDSLYLVTDLSQEEILKLFMHGTEPFPEIGTVPRPNPDFPMRYVNTESYSIDCDKASIEYATQFHYSDFGIIPTIEMIIFYKANHVTKGQEEIALKTIQLLNQITGDIVFLYKDHRALRRDNGKLRLVQRLWNSELLSLIKQDYELVESENVE